MQNSHLYNHTSLIKSTCKSVNLDGNVFLLLYCSTVAKTRSYVRLVKTFIVRQYGVWRLELWNRPALTLPIISQIQRNGFNYREIPHGHGSYSFVTYAYWKLSHCPFKKVTEIPRWRGWLGGFWPCPWPTSCSERPSMISEISCSLLAMVADSPVPLCPTLQDKQMEDEKERKQIHKHTKSEKDSALLYSFSCRAPRSNVSQERFLPKDLLSKNIFLCTKSL